MINKKSICQTENVKGCYMNNLKIPVGISDFTKIRENGYYYIDKTELICSLLEPEPAEVTLITDRGGSERR